jgi:hypothetical protein
MMFSGRSRRNLRLFRVPFGLLLALAPAMYCHGQEAAVPDADDGGQRDPAPVEEPTEAQIHDAYAGMLATVNAGSKAHLGAADSGAVLIELEDIVKLGCRGLDRSGAEYDCRVERRIRRGDARPETGVVQLWLSWENGRWVAR